MKVFETLVCLLLGTASFAQQSLQKDKEVVSQKGDMPILRGHGDALEMPTRNGRGEALAIPNRPTPVPNNPSENSAMVMQSLKNQIERFLADSLNREKPRDTLPTEKN